MCLGLRIEHEVIDGGEEHDGVELVCGDFGFECADEFIGRFIHEFLGGGIDGCAKHDTVKHHVHRHVFACAENSVRDNKKSVFYLKRVKICLK